MEYPKEGLLVIRGTVNDKKPVDIIINHVPPAGMDISEVSVDRLEAEALAGLHELAEEGNWSNGEEIVFFISYCKEAAIV